jgi:threonine dehydrogenase-like Zn-dependent dehydrogenase
MKVKGVHLPGDKKAHVKEWEIEEPKDDEVLVEIKAAALCRSDMSIYYGVPLIPGFPPGTYITGHEPSGVISKVGPCVRNFKEGDRVAVICFVGCGHCRYCRAGEPNLCDTAKCLGFTTHGGDAEYLVVPERTCLPIPDEMSYALGAVSTDAIGNLYSTMKYMSVSGDDFVAVAGVGPMGLSAVLCALAMGATVVAFDPMENRLKKAKELGAHYVANPHKVDPEEFIRNISKEGVTKAIDCSAENEAINYLLNSTRKHGIVSQIGEPGAASVTINPSEQLIHKKLTYVGSWYFALPEWDDITRFIIEKIGVERAESIISHRYPLEEAAADEAFKLFDRRETYKVVFTP